MTMRRFLLIMALGTLGPFWYTAPAKADPDEQVTLYASWASRAVCETLDDHPTLPGVAGVIAGVARDSGFETARAAQVVALAVIYNCPQHVPLLQRYAASLDTTPAVTV